MERTSATFATDQYPCPSLPVGTCLNPPTSRLLDLLDGKKTYKKVIKHISVKKTKKRRSSSCSKESCLEFGIPISGHYFEAFGWKRKPYQSLAILFGQSRHPVSCPSWTQVQSISSMYTSMSPLYRGSSSEGLESPLNIIGRPSKPGRKYLWGFM